MADYHANRDVYTEIIKECNNNSDSSRNVIYTVGYIRDKQPIRPQSPTIQNVKRKPKTTTKRTSTTIAILSIRVRNSFSSNNNDISNSSNRRCRVEDVGMGYVGWRWWQS